MADGDGELPSLADTIAAVHRELSLARAAGQGQLAQFRAGPVELDFEVAVTRTGGGQAGVQLWVLPLDGKGDLAHAATQRIKVTLQPLDPETRQHGQVTEGLQGTDVMGFPTSAGSVPPDRPVRAEGLEIHEVDDGLLVYQAQPECIHHLNNTAAIVFELCDGENTVAEISEQLALAFGLKGMPDGVAEKCIADLRDKAVIV
jgi:Trypsin-co-occurring domain 2/Coenzyme PQQ synthesis protein D (PqqD)